MYTYSDYQAQTSLLAKLEEDARNERRNGWEIAVERIEKQIAREEKKLQEITADLVAEHVRATSE